MLTLPLATVGGVAAVSPFILAFEGATNDARESIYSIRLDADRGVMDGMTDDARKDEVVGMYGGLLLLENSKA